MIGNKNRFKLDRQDLVVLGISILKELLMLLDHHFIQFKKNIAPEIYFLEKYKD
jgi:hypothetical protein